MSGDAPALALRPARDGDAEFLARLYASTRVDDPALAGWSEQQREAFIVQQFHAQTVHYSQHYADASFDVVIVGGETAGRLIVDRRERELDLVDISLLPEHRGRGIGTALLQTLLDEGDGCGMTVGLQVQCYNRALRLYKRLGFSIVEDAGVYLRMERPAGADQVKIAS